jgi:uncharacterized protein (DUF2249 family)
MHHKVIDARALPPLERHPLIFSTFDSLHPGQAFELINNHDPVPLFFRFRQVRTGLFDWHYVQSGPGQWRVRITRTAGAPLSCKDGQAGPGGAPALDD